MGPLTLWIYCEFLQTWFAVNSFSELRKINAKPQTTCQQKSLLSCLTIEKGSKWLILKNDTKRLYVRKRTDLARNTSHIHLKKDEVIP